MAANPKRIACLMTVASCAGCMLAVFPESPPSFTLYEVDGRAPRDTAAFVLPCPGGANAAPHYLIDATVHISPEFTDASGRMPATMELLWSDTPLIADPGHPSPPCGAIEPRVLPTIARGRAHRIGESIALEWDDYLGPPDLVRAVIPRLVPIRRGDPRFSAVLGVAGQEVRISLWLNGD